MAALPLLVEVGFIATLSGILARAETERAAERITRRETSLNARFFGQMSLAPYLLALSVYTKSEKVKRLFHHEIDLIKETQQELIAYYKKYPYLVPERTLQKALRVQDQMYMLLTEAEKAIDADPTEMSANLEKLAESFRRAQDLVRNDIAKGFADGEIKTIAVQDGLQQTLLFQYIVLILGILGNVGLGIFLAFFYRRTILERINVIAKNTEAISGKGWLIPQIGGDDEIGKLDHAFHLMYKSLLKASEMEKALFNNASDVICVLDENNEFIRINPAGIRTWGFPLEKLSKKALSTIVIEEDQAKIASMIELAKQESESSAQGAESSTASAAAPSFEAGIRTRTGEVRFGLWSIYWSAEVQNLFCIFHDITEHRTVEQERKSFLAMISSDLQKPLVQISESVEKLSLGAVEGLPDKARERLNIAERNLKRLLVLVKDLIQVSEMESGNIELNCTMLSVNELLSRSASEIQQTAEARGIQMELGSSNLQVYADPDKVMQVLVNLLSNAVKFSPEKSSVRLFAESADRSGKFVKFSVQDFGRGIPAGQTDSVFQKFKQVELSDAKRKAGTGLGLPICKELIERHGGQINVVSEPGVGSTFWFTLPSSESVLGADGAQRKGEGNEDREGADRNISRQAAGAPRIAAGSKDRGGADRNRSGRDARTPGKGSKAREEANQKGGRQTVSVPGKVPDKKSSRFRFPLSWQGAILVGVPLFFELGFVILLSISLLNVQSQRANELEMRKIAFYASKGLRTIMDVSTTLIHLRGERMADQQDYDNYGKEWDEDYTRLSEATEKYQDFTEVKKKLAVAREKILASERQINASRSASTIMNIVSQLMTVTRHLIEIVDIAEDLEFVDSGKDRHAAKEQSKILIGGLVLNSIISLLLCIYFALSFSRRLMIMADNTRRLANEEALNKPVGGADEITDLDRAFHTASVSLTDSRRRERAIFDNCKDVLCVVSKDGKFMSVNPAVQTAWGFDRNEILSSSLLKVVPEQNFSKLKELVFNIPDKAIEESVDVPLGSADKSMIWTRWTVSRSKGQPSAFCVVRDVTNLKQLEQLRKDFLAVVSHDLRTPLTGVMGVANLISANAFGPLTGPAKTVVVTIERNCDMLLELINDILDLEKLEAGQMQLDLQAADLKQLIDRLLIISKHLPATIQVRAGGDKLGEKFLCDHERIIQALHNLIRYLAYRDPGAANTARTIRIQASQIAPGIEIQIFDGGPLIPVAIRERIFERIKDSSLKEQLSESSFHAELSLPLAAQIIASHGGTISLEAVENNNLFRIRLPYLSA